MSIIEQIFPNHVFLGTFKGVQIWQSSFDANAYTYVTPDGQTAQEPIGWREAGAAGFDQQGGGAEEK